MSMIKYSYHREVTVAYWRYMATDMSVNIGSYSGFSGMGHQANTCNYVDWTSVRFSVKHLRAIHLEVSQPRIAEINFEMTYLKFHTNLPWANKFILWYEGTTSHKKYEEQLWNNGVALTGASFNNWG